MLGEIFLIIFCCVIIALMFSLIFGLFGNPFVPTPSKSIEQIMSDVPLTSKDIVYDMGSGDGRVIFAVSKKHVAKAVGVEYAWYLYLLSLGKRLFCKERKHIVFLKKDMFHVDVSDGTVIFCYILPRFLSTMEEKLERELKKGTKVISYTFPLKKFTLQKELKGKGRTIYIYEV